MIPLATAERVAATVLQLLRPALAEYAVVGSIRRRREMVKDLEIVVRPKPATPVFGEPRSAVSALEALLPRLVERRDLALCPDPKRRLDGRKQKRLWFPHPGIEVELFIADADNFGNTVVIRTGDFEFSRALVTKWSAGGLMPKGLLHDEGYLWRLGWQKVSCPTETDFFVALGIEEPPQPYARDLEAAKRLRAQLARERVRA